MNDPIEPIAGGISSVAQLFLSQSNNRNAAKGRAKPGQSSPPAQVAPSPSGEHIDIVAPPEISEPITQTETTTEQVTPPIPTTDQTAGMSIFYDHVDNPIERLEQFAAQATYHNGQVALAHVTDANISLSHFTTEFENSAKQASDPQIFDHFSDVEKFGHHLSSIHISCEAILVSIDVHLREKLSGLLAQSASLILFTGSGPDEIIKTYQVLKWIASHPLQTKHLPEISLYICDSGDTEHAITLFNRLEETAKKFLRLPLQYHGCNETIDMQISQTELCSVAYHDKIISMLQDAISHSDPLSDTMPASNAPVNPVDSENIEPATHKTNTNANIEQIEVPAGLKVTITPDTIEQTNSESIVSESIVEETVTKTQTTTQKQLNTTTSVQANAITVEAFPNTPNGLSQALVSNLNSWLPTLPQAIHIPASLDKAMKDHQGCNIILDANGRLHGVVSSLDQADSLLVKSLVLQKWIEVHTKLIQSSFKQLLINATLKPGVIIVTSKCSHDLKTAAEQLTELPIQIMQLKCINNGDIKSLQIA